MAQAKPRHPHANPTPQDRVNAETRRYQMLELYKGGATERQIAEVLQVDRALVHRDIKRVLRELAEKYANVADEIRGLQMERYTTLLQRWWQPAVGGDEHATKMVLQIMHRISEINGVIPDKPLISIDQRSIQLQQGEVTFSIEAASANYEPNGQLPPAEPIPETT
jgi:hypothetical protein